MMARFAPLLMVTVQGKDNSTCPGVGVECKTLGADGLACCGAEHGAGFAFCQTDPDYLCCSGDSYAISCPSAQGCSKSEYGIPLCQKEALEEVKDNATCPGIGKKCEVLGADGLACCGAEHGAGLAFCQTDPQYTCCSGASFAITCPKASECEISDAGLPNCVAQLDEVKDNSTCPGVGVECKTLGADGLACCGAEHGAGFAFCQTDPDYLCCSGDSYAISCPAAQGCSKSEYGIPLCQKEALEEVKDNATCPGIGKKCEVLGADGLACCGAEHGAGLAFCQTDPQYTCCSGASYAITCPKASECEISDAGLPNCVAQLEEVKDNATCPGIGKKCEVLGADGLACCGAEHGAGLAFCQTDPQYTCCSGASYAITCPKASECEISDAGLPNCVAQLEEVKDNSTCPGVGAECKTLGADGLACCGAEHGAGFAFCQTDPDYLCCSGDSFAITCPSASGCSKNEYGIPLCQKEAKVNRFLA